MKAKNILKCLGICFLVAALSALFLFNAANSHFDEDVALYIDADDNADSIITKIDAPWLMRLFLHSEKFKLHTGYYLIKKENPLWHIALQLHRGQQTPVRLTIPSVRTLPQLAGLICEKLMMDSVALINLLQDRTICDRYEKSPATMPVLFLPDTYECFWNISPEGLLQRMQREWLRYWTEERRAKAEAMRLTPEEVTTLASIVDEETNYAPEKPRVAGLYLNRLRRGMLLQADPTVKFAVGDFSLRRILHQHLVCESPYNTYVHQGLPPGPIRIASKAGIDAVLNAENHTFIYMCAKEDFSGAHNFAASYSEHQNNAKRYTRELNKRGIR